MAKPSENQSGVAEPIGTIVRGTLVRLSNELAPVRVPGAGPAAEPHVEVIRNGEVVQALDVYCACGRHLRLRCVYE